MLFIDGQEGRRRREGRNQTMQYLRSNLSLSLSLSLDASCLLLYLPSSTLSAVPREKGEREREERKSSNDLKSILYALVHLLIVALNWYFFFSFGIWSQHCHT